MRRLIAALALLLLAGCTCPSDYTGHVTEKHFTPAHIIFIPVYHSTGKSGFTTLQPIPVPDQYEVSYSKDQPDTSYRTWYGAKRREPLIYHRLDSYLTDPISFSQLSRGSIVRFEFPCNHRPPKGE